MMFAVFLRRRPSGSSTALTPRRVCSACGGGTQPPWSGSCPTPPSSSVPTNFTKRNSEATMDTRESESAPLLFIIIIIIITTVWLFHWAIIQQRLLIFSVLQKQLLR